MEGVAIQVCSALAVPCCLLFVVVPFFCTNTITPTQYGLKFNWWNEEVFDNDGVAFQNGLYILPPWYTFIKFPAMVETVSFSKRQGNDISSRTSDGLAVGLECSMQYQVMASNVSAMYRTLGEADDARVFMEKAAQSLIMTESTHYSAHEFFANRSMIAPLIEAKLRNMFRSKLFAYLQFFQLSTVFLPFSFEEAIKNTTLTTQQMAQQVAQRHRLAIEWETELLKMQQHVNVRINEAKARATEIELIGEAKGERLKLHATGDAAAILVKARAEANATQIQRMADSHAVTASKRTEAGTIRLQSLTLYNVTKLKHYLEACSYASMKQAAGSEEVFLELMKVRALQNVSWKKMSVNLGKGLDALSFMGLASSV